MKIIPLESTMFEVSSDIYFIVYDLYYVDQNDDLRTRVGPIHRDGGSMRDEYPQIAEISFINLCIIKNILFGF
jgi:hypothetical protein